MRGRIVKTNNASRTQYLNSEGEFGFGGKTFNMIIDNGDRKGKIFHTSEVKEIIIKTRNSIYKVEVLPDE